VSAAGLPGDSMRCSKCAAENREGRKFCAQCGTGLNLRCPSCGAGNTPGEKYCGECGAALAGTQKVSESRPAAPGIRVRSEQSDSSAALEGERKTVTALFADIKGSTELEQDLDPEEARAIIDPAIKLMIDAARRYDGYVVQSTGDGIFALFGAPVAHEDHPQRALYAGLRMQEELKRYSARLVAEGRNPLQGRVGINSGEVVVRSITTGAGQTEYTPIGHTTNLASRMQAVAPVGSIAVAEPTRKLVEGYFALKPLGPTRVKGVSEPVNVYEVTGLGPLRTRLQRSAGRGYTKFVGRQREMDAMKAVAEQAKAGHGQIVAAMAEPGVGKSRLIFEFKAVSESGWMVLETFSVSHGKASAFLPVIDLLHGYFKISSADEARARREKVAGKIVILDPTLGDALPYLYALLGIVEEPDPLTQMDAQVRKRRTLDAIKRILIRESLNQPLMVIFEDLHWIDEGTQEFLNLLADSIGTAKILLLVNYRPEYSHQWGSRTYYTQLRLDPLGKESADDMLQSLLGDSGDLGPLKRLIIEKTEGNPFFMEEMMQVLFDQGALVRNGSIRLIKPLAALKIPPTVQAILASRIDRLPAEEKSLLQMVAVLGRQFSLDLVKRIANGPEEELTRLLADLQLAEFIYEQPAISDTEYTFKHALTQEVAYNSLLVERRKALHERAGAAIAELYAERPEPHYDDLAHHYSRSGDTRKAVQYLMRAGIAALERGGYAQSLERFSSGLELLRTLPDSSERTNWELDLQLKLVVILQAVRGQGDEETLSALQRADELCRLSGRTGDLTVLLGLRSYYFFAGQINKAREFADRALVLAEQSDEPTGVILADYSAAHTYFYLGEFLSSLQHAEKARALAGPRPEPWARRTHLQALHETSRSLWFLGFRERAALRSREASDVARSNLDPFQSAITTGALAELHAYGGQNEQMKQHLEEHLALNAKYGFAPVIPGRAKILEGWWQVERGESELGIAMIRGGIELNSASNNAANAAFYSSLLTRAYARAGRLNDGLRVLDQAIARVEQSGERFFEAELFRLKGELLHSSNADAPSIKTCLRKAIEVARSQSAKSLELRATTSLARLLAKQSNRDEARAMLAEIYGWFTEGFDTADLKDAKALLDQLA